MPKNTPDWQSYEREVHEELKTKYFRSTVCHNVKLRGLRSGALRQIDVLVEDTSSTGSVRTVVEAKYRRRPIDVKQVEAFLGLLQDVGAPQGVMISPVGYSKAALARATRDDVDLDLDVLTLDEFRQWQTAIAIPYAGRNGIVLPAPVGWVIDVSRMPGNLARLYRRGLTFPQAVEASEFMYVNIWDRRPPITDLDLLLKMQAEAISENFPGATIAVESTKARADARTCLRRAEIPGYSGPEVTGLAEFRNGIVFIVLHTPASVERRNVRKLEYILRTMIPVAVQHAA
jgi:hypothetical protein